MGLAPACRPHTLGYACTLYAPTSPLLIVGFDLCLILIFADFQVLNGVHARVLQVITEFQANSHCLKPGLYEEDHVVNQLSIQETRLATIFLGLMDSHSQLRRVFRCSFSPPSHHLKREMKSPHLVELS